MIAACSFSSSASGRLKSMSLVSASQVVPLPMPAPLVFDGRIAEDFKLVTGTWVHTGALRVAAVAAASPVLQDAVVADGSRTVAC